MDDLRFRNLVTALPNCCTSGSPNRRFCRKPTGGTAAR